MVPDDWKKAIIVPLYKGKGSRSECSSYRVRKGKNWRNFENREKDGLETKGKVNKVNEEGNV